MGNSKQLHDYEGKEPAWALEQRRWALIEFKKDSQKVQESVRQFGVSEKAAFI